MIGDFAKSIPPYVILLVVFLALLTDYYLRPDPVIFDFLKGTFGALLICINPSHKSQP